MGLSIKSVSIEDFYTVNSCPAKLYLKYKGIKLPFLGGRNERKIEPVAIGNLGEKRFQKALAGEIKSEVEEVILKREISKEDPSIETVEGIEQILKNRDSIKGSLEILSNQIHNLLSEARSLLLKKEVKENQFLTELKNKYKLSEIIPKVRFYNVSHHYEGKIDFLGVTKSGETKILEIKNTKKSSLTKHKLQLSLYLDGMNKRFLAHGSDISTGIDTNDILDRLGHTANLPSFQRKEHVNFWDYVLIKLYDNYPKLLHKNLQSRLFTQKLYRYDSPQYNIFRNLQSKLRELEHKENLTKAEEQVQRFLLKETLFTNIKNTFSENKQKYEDNQEFGEAIKEIISEVQILLDQEPDEGILVYLQKDKEIGITEPIVDTNYLGKKVWDVKRRIFNNENFVMKIEEENKCSRCPYQKFCMTIEKSDDIEKNLKSSIVLVDKEIERIIKNELSAEVSISTASYAYKKLKEKPEQASNEFKKWGNKDEIIKRTPSYRKFFLAKRSNKFGKEIRYWS